MPTTVVYGVPIALNRSRLKRILLSGPCCDLLVLFSFTSALACLVLMFFAVPTQLQNFHRSREMFAKRMDHLKKFLNGDVWSLHAFKDITRFKRQSVDNNIKPGNLEELLQSAPQEWQVEPASELQELSIEGRSPRSDEPLTKNIQCQGPPGAAGLDGWDGTDGATGLDGPPGVDGLLDVFEDGCLVCPAGKPGRPGPPGERGSPGEKGIKGATGESGENGNPGEAGVEAGPMGFPGEPGPQGAPGIPAPDVITGKGRLGPPGSQGTTGEPGPDGIPGESVPNTETAVGAKGAPGPPGNDGLKGERGEPGPDGPPGQDIDFCPCPAQTSSGISYTPFYTEPLTNYPVWPAAQERNNLFSQRPFK